MKKEPASEPLPGTAKIISAALDADGGITPAHRRRIMEAIATGPAGAPAVPAALDGFYTPTEAAKLCGVTLAGLLLWVRAGKMEAQRIGKRNYLIPAAAVDAMLAKRKPAPIRADALPDRFDRSAIEKSIAGTRRIQQLRGKSNADGRNHA